MHAQGGGLVNNPEDHSHVLLNQDSGEVNLVEFALGTPALSPATAADLVEAAAVCLIEEGHQDGVILEVRPPPSVQLRFSEPDQRAFASRADPQETTERGATAIALALLKAKTGYGVIERARKGTGCDWYLGDDDGGPPFQKKLRMEVSGIRQEDEQELRRRGRQKRAQLMRGDDKREGFVVIVGFVAPVATVEAP